MNLIFTIYGIAIILLAFVGIYNLVNYIRYYSQFKAFNDNVKNWSKEIDASVREAIGIQSRIILQELDEKIEKEKELNNNDNNLEENDED